MNRKVWKGFGAVYILQRCPFFRYVLRSKWSRHRPRKLGNVGLSPTGNDIFRVFSSILKIAKIYNQCELLFHEIMICRFSNNAITWHESDSFSGIRTETSWLVDGTFELRRRHEQPRIKRSFACSLSSLQQHSFISPNLARVAIRTFYSFLSL